MITYIAALQAGYCPVSFLKPGHCPALLLKNVPLNTDFAKNGAFSFGVSNGNAKLTLIHQIQPDIVRFYF